jgi:hypothetical protein
MVLTVSFALSPVTGLVCHRRLAEITPAKLDASVGASGPHDFAVRASVVRLPTPSRPPHPASTFVTMRNAPLIEAGREKYTPDLHFGKTEIFFEKGWTSNLRK